MGSLEGLESPEINGIAKTGWQSLRRGYDTEYVITYSIATMPVFPGFLASGGILWKLQ